MSHLFRITCDESLVCLKVEKKHPMKMIISTHQSINHQTPQFGAQGAEPMEMKLWWNIWTGGAGIAQWLERRTRDWMVVGLNPCRSGGRIFFSRVDYLCWLLFQYLFHPCVTAVARKRSRSFCQKCRWQVTVKHAYTLRMWLCLKWHCAWLYGVHRTCAKMAAVSCGTSHASAVSTPLWWIFKNVL